jgi:hypothetical protein
VVEMGMLRMTPACRERVEVVLPNRGEEVDGVSGNDSISGVSVSAVIGRMLGKEPELVDRVDKGPTNQSRRFSINTVHDLACMWSFGPSAVEVSR